MRRHAHASRLITLAVTTFSLPAVLRADSPAPPFSWTKPTADGRHVFVMRSPPYVSAPGGRWSDENKPSIRAIRLTYPQSGLYRNDGSTAPLWAVDWYAYEGNVDVASDGVHLVRRDGGGSMESSAFSFFANGRLVRRYTIGELVDAGWRLDRSVTRLFWSKHEAFDDAALRYVVDTADGNAFVFDVATGAILSESRQILYEFWIAAGVLILAAVTLLCWGLRRRG
jgi:hypothetical protein